MESKVENILIVSDNYELTSFVMKEVDNLSCSVKIDYCYTILNGDPNILKDIGCQCLDMKNKGQVENVIKKYDLVMSLHCKQIFPEKLVNSLPCINLHPGLNPHNRGWYPQVFSIINKKPIGATLHMMDKKIDHGDIIEQKEVDIFHWDTSYSVYRRVINIEKEILSNNIENIIRNQIVSYKLSEDGNYNGIDNFKELCKLDLSMKATLGEHIDLLRALSHANFRNAYFITETGHKVFIRISLERVDN